MLLEGKGYPKPLHNPGWGGGRAGLLESLTAVSDHKINQTKPKSEDLGQRERGGRGEGRKLGVEFLATRQ